MADRRRWAAGEWQPWQSGEALADVESDKTARKQVTSLPDQIAFATAKVSGLEGLMSIGNDGVVGAKHDLRSAGNAGSPGAADPSSAPAEAGASPLVPRSGATPRQAQQSGQVQ